MKNLFFYGPLQKYLHTWLLHLLGAFILHSCHCGCTCLAPVIPRALRKENRSTRKDSECTQTCPHLHPVRQSKITSWQSSKVKQNVTFHHQSWGIACGECYPWLLTLYHSCHHLSSSFKATSRFLELLALFQTCPLPPFPVTCPGYKFLAMIQLSLSLTCHPHRPHCRETPHKMELNLPPSKG